MHSLQRGSCHTDAGIRVRFCEVSSTTAFFYSAALLLLQKPVGEKPHVVEVSRTYGSSACMCGSRVLASGVCSSSTYIDIYGAMSKQLLSELLTLMTKGHLLSKQTGFSPSWEKSEGNSRNTRRGQLLPGCRTDAFELQNLDQILFP